MTQMLEPSLTLQKAIRHTLLADLEVTALVDPNNIRSGSTRPDKLPCIVMANGQTVFLGNAAGRQYLAQASIDVHIWALEDGADTAKQIGFAVSNALKQAPDTNGYSFDSFSLPSIRWLRDPDPDKAYTHGVLTVEAVIRWSV